jgi:hypothetical protein
MPGGVKDMDSYNQFAPFYDATMGERADVIAILTAEFIAYAPIATSLIELGCGTASIIQPFQDKFVLAGVDLSASMLKIAQRKIPKGNFYHEDISTFRSDRPFDIALCVFDTINHLPDLIAWKSLFECTYLNLSTNGLFIFDMNTVGRMKKLLQLPTYVQDLGNIVVEMDIFPAGKDTVDWLINVQEPQTDGTIQVYEDTARERSYPMSKVLPLLAKSGFDLLDTFDSDHHAGNDNSDRIYFICRKR